MTHFNSKLPHFRSPLLSSLTFSGAMLAALFALSTPSHARTERSESLGTPAASSSYDRFGLGVMLGVPTGLNAKYRFNSRDALDFGLAFSFNNYVEAYSDYLYHFPGAFRNSTAASWSLTPYIGVGAVIFGNTTGRDDPGSRYFSSTGSNTDIGVRIPLGIEWLSHRIPLGAFGELVPGVGIVPGTFAFFEGDVGARFYF